REDATQHALREWRARSAPTPAAQQGFETIREMLQGVAGQALQARAQEFPPKFELKLPPATKGGHEWDFASVAAAGDELYFDLYPLGLDVVLRDLVGPALRKRMYRVDDGFKLPGGLGKFVDEVRTLIEASRTWFQSEIVPSRPLPPCQAIDQYLIEPAD